MELPILLSPRSRKENGRKPETASRSSATSSPLWKSSAILSSPGIRTFQSVSWTNCWRGSAAPVSLRDHLRGFRRGSTCPHLKSPSRDSHHQPRSPILLQRLITFKKFIRALTALKGSGRNSKPFMTGANKKVAPRVPRRSRFCPKPRIRTRLSHLASHL